MPRPCTPCNDVVEIDAKRHKLHELEGGPTGICSDKISYIIQNTFIAVPAPRSPSLEEFIKPRLSKSLSGSAMEEIPREIKAMGIDTVQIKPQTSASKSSTTIHLDQFMSLEQGLQTRECPTVGSRGHGQGECKPCAFFWTEGGCRNGPACKFCHLCDSGATKRRAKEKKKLRAITKFQQALLGRMKTPRNGC